MNELPNKPSIDPELEARIVALVLGEASDLERDQLDQLLAARPELFELKRHFEGVHGLLQDVGEGETWPAETEWRLPPEKRKMVLSVIDGEANAVSSPSTLVRSIDAASSTVASSTVAPSKRLWTQRVHSLGRVAAVFCIAGFVGLLSMLVWERSPLARRNRSLFGGTTFTASALSVSEPKDSSRTLERGFGIAAGTEAVWAELPALGNAEGMQVAEKQQSSETSSRSLGRAPSPLYAPSSSFESDYANAPSPSYAPYSPPPTEPSPEPQTYFFRSGESFDGYADATESTVPQVSVPDGGEILLGGIRRFRQADASGGKSSTDTVDFERPLALTITPRIIIQEEVEERYGLADPQPARGLDDQVAQIADGESRVSGLGPVDGGLVDGGLVVGGLGGGGLGGGMMGGGGMGMGSGGARDYARKPDAPDRNYHRFQAQQGQVAQSLVESELLSDWDADVNLAADLPTGPDAKQSNTWMFDGPAVQQPVQSTVRAYVDLGVASGAEPATLGDLDPTLGTHSGFAGRNAGGLTLPSTPSDTASETKKDRLSELQDLERQLGADETLPSIGLIVESDKAAMAQKSSEFFGTAGKPLSPAKSKLSPSDSKEEEASTQAFSTFSLHVSDVAFKLALAAFGQGEWPDADRVRIEEFVNAFDYGDPLPSENEKVACQVEQAAHPFLQQRNIMRVSLRTAAAGRAASTPLRLTLLVDNSGSMERIDRQQTVRRAFAQLAGQLNANDEITLISFARQPRLLADSLNGTQAMQLVTLLDDLPSEGGTNIEAALQLAFEKAKEHQTEGAQNRIILLTDGAVNLGDASPDGLSRMITTIRDSGIAFDAAGISADGLNDEVLEALARQGDGRYYLLDSQESVDDGFARQIAGALRPSAKNVKVQIEFNPARVGHYKLLGFEKHLLKQEDFRNDQVDAAEMAAAEAGVAVYQFEAKPDGEGDIGSVSVRFRDLSTGQMIENRWPIPYEASAARIDQAPSSLRIAAAAALLAAKLRGEPLGASVDLKSLSELVAGLPERVRTAQRVEQLQFMIQQARQLTGN